MKRWQTGSAAMKSGCSYNYEPLNWMFCCYPSKNSIGEKSNLELCDNQSKATTNGLCLFALYYMRKKKCSDILQFERWGGREKLSSIKVSLYKDWNFFPVEFYQTKRGDLFLWNLFLKWTGQFFLIYSDLQRLGAGKRTFEEWKAKPSAFQNVGLKRYQKIFAWVEFQLFHRLTVLSGKYPITFYNHLTNSYLTYVRIQGKNRLLSEMLRDEKKKKSSFRRQHVQRTTGVSMTWRRK